MDTLLESDEKSLPNLHWSEKDEFIANFVWTYNALIFWCLHVFLGLTLSIKARGLIHL